MSDDVKSDSSESIINAKLKICIIGAGVNGLCVTKHLIENGLNNITVFEATSVIAGLWNYNPDPNYPNALYKNLTTNIHRTTMHFPDLDFETECKKTHPHHSFILQYVQYYAKYFDLTKYIKFNHNVLKVTPPNTDIKNIIDNKTIFPQWSVEYEDIKHNEIEQEAFDALIVCNGHFVKEYIPYFEGFSITKIKWFHSRSYREPKNELFDNRLIVIIGAGYSGRDIAKEIVENCKNVTIYQVLHSPYSYGSKERFVKKCFIKRFSEYSVEFDDGIIIFPDLVIFCTGYLHDYPFLNHKEFLEHPLIKIKNGFECTGQSVNGLFEHMIYPFLPTIFFPGINHGVVPFLHAYYQSKWIAKILTDLKYDIKGNKDIIWSSKYLSSNKEEMIEWMNKRNQFSGLRQQHFLPNQTPYFEYICQQIGDMYQFGHKKQSRGSRRLRIKQ